MADVWLTFSVSAGTPSIPNNTTPVTVTVYANWRYGYYNKNNKSGTLTIDGTAYSFASPFNTGVSSSGSSALATKTKTVAHNPDGKKTVSISASYVTGVVGTVSASTSKTLTTIPRVSDIEIDLDTIPADGTSLVIATATKKATSFTDVLTVTLGDYSQEVESGVAFSIPETWNNAISGTSAKATVEVETFSGDDSIGTKTVELTITVPDSVVPIITGIDVSEAVAKVTEAFGNIYVQNLSQLNISINASGVYGSTIRSYSTSFNGVSYIAQAFTSNVILGFGDLVIKTTVVDSRGRTATYEKTVTIAEYSVPVITAMRYINCDAEGTENANGEYTKVIISYKVSSVNGLNTKSMKLKYKATSEATFIERALTLNDWEGTVETIVSGTSPSTTYEYIAEISDKISTPNGTRITTGVTVLSRLAGGKGITLFGEAEEEGFVIKGDEPMKFISDVALAGTRQHLNYIGVNPIASTEEDTPANWAALGTGHAYISGNGKLKNQPAQYGVLESVIVGSIAFQTFNSYTTGSVGTKWTRSGKTGWNVWVKSLDETNGIQMKKLWENASPTSSFGAQTINLDLSEYDEIEVLAKWGKASAKASIVDKAIRGGFGVLFRIENTSVYREFEFNDTGVIFNAGNYKSSATNSSVVNNDYVIPVVIYGIKGVQ